MLHQRQHSALPGMALFDSRYCRTTRTLMQIAETMRHRYHLSIFLEEAKRFLNSTVCYPCGRILDIELNDGIRLSLHDAIDRDHETGRIRGRLCMSCNTREEHLKGFKNNPYGLITRVGKEEAARWFEWWGQVEPYLLQRDDVRNLFLGNTEFFNCIPMEIEPSYWNRCW